MKLQNIIKMIIIQKHTSHAINIHRLHFWNYLPFENVMANDSSKKLNTNLNLPVFYTSGKVNPKIHQLEAMNNR